MPELRAFATAVLAAAVGVPRPTVPAAAADRVDLRFEVGASAGLVLLAPLVVGLRRRQRR